MNWERGRGKGNLKVKLKYGAWISHPSSRPGGGGYSLIYAVQVCATPLGRVFAPSWSENESTLCQASHAYVLRGSSRVPTQRTFEGEE